MSTNKSKNEAATSHGVWTPDARTLCVDCHNALEPRPTWWREATAPPNGAHNPSNIAAPCDSCGQLAWQRSDVGLLRNFVALVGEGARLEQTGGMCCAARVDVDGGARVVIVTEDEDSDVGRVVACVYDRTAWEDGEGESTELVVGVSIESAVAAVKKITEGK